MLLSGSCHCQNVRFELDWGADPLEIPARACGCSFCQKHGGVWTANPDGQLKVFVREPEAVAIYTFGTRTADFHVCRHCGVVPLVSCRIESALYAVVSVNALDQAHRNLLRVAPANFDGEALDARLARRARNWISQVEFIEDAEAAA